MGREIKAFIHKTLLVIAGILISIIISEIISGIYLKKTKLDKKIKYMEDALGHYRPSAIGCYDKQLGWGLKPGTEYREIISDFDVTYSINSCGIRDKAISFEKPLEEIRIIALGESNVFGWGVDYGRRFTEIIEQALRNVELVNMGVGGFGMDQSLLQLERDAFKFNPDMVVLFIHNDYIERCKDVIRDWGEFKPRFILNEEKAELILQDLKSVKEKFRKQKAVLESGGTFRKIIGIIEIFFGKSNLVALLNYHINCKKIKEKLRDRDKTNWDRIFDKLGIINEYRKEHNKQDFEKLVFLLLKKYKELCDNHKVDFLVVKLDKIDFVDSLLCKLDISFLDLSGILNRASKSKPLRFALDPHFNEFAHKVIGEYLVDYFKEKYSLKKNADFIYQYLEEF